MFDSFLRMMSGADDLTAILPHHPLIIDVRTPAEYVSGNIAGSHNIPLDRLDGLVQLYPDRTTPIIVCCASGSRSAAAKRLLVTRGYIRVFNGGGWQMVQASLSRTSSW